MFVDNNVDVFFHGHDHFYGKQEKDGVIYQEVPQPSNRNITNVQASEYGYVNGLFLPGRGYLSVTVADDGATVKYIRTCLPTEENATRKNKEVADSYTVKSVASYAGPVNGLPLLKLDQNFPNPFQSETLINYEISTAGQVQLFITDSFGRALKSLVNQYQPAGPYSLAWNAGSQEFPEGIYYVVLKTAGQILSKRIIKIN